MAKGTGKKKIDIKKVQNPQYRKVTFCKRRKGLLKKVKEISRITGAEFAVLFRSEAGRFYTDASSSFDSLLDHYLQGDNNVAVAEPIEPLNVIYSDDAAMFSDNNSEEMMVSQPDLGDSESDLLQSDWVPSSMAVEKAITKANVDETLAIETQTSTYDSLFSYESPSMESIWEARFPEEPIAEETVSGFCDTNVDEWERGLFPIRVLSDEDSFVNQFLLDEPADDNQITEIPNVADPCIDLGFPLTIERLLISLYDSPDLDSFKL